MKFVGPEIRGAPLGGFYWWFQGAKEPQIVQLVLFGGPHIFTCGDEQGWPANAHNLGETDVFVGPLAPPERA